MSKGRCLTKRKWGDFRKQVKWKVSIITKFPRGALGALDVQHISMKGSWTYPKKDW